MQAWTSQFAFFKYHATCICFPPLPICPMYELLQLPFSPPHLPYLFASVLSSFLLSSFVIVASHFFLDSCIPFFSTLSEFPRFFSSFHLTSNLPLSFRLSNHLVGSHPQSSFAGNCWYESQDLFFRPGIGSLRSRRASASLVTRGATTIRLGNIRPTDLSGKNPCSKLDLATPTVKSDPFLKNLVPAYVGCQTNQNTDKDRISSGLTKHMKWSNSN